jgi:glycosyltransferase involved in cell wall biosynthesis
VIPARNEARNIGPCLEGACAQSYPGLEVIVVDDRSEDGTGDIVRERAACDPRVHLVEGSPLPDGWIGKCWALHQGARAARGDWLLFVDADTRLQPGAAAGAVEEAQRRGAAVLSAITGQELPTVWERIVQPAVYLALAEGMPITLVNNPKVPQIAIANGQFLLVRRDAYDAIGGHEAIRDEIAEDAQFARRTKRLGWRFWLGDGRHIARTRMYTRPYELWEGWTKNLHVATRLIPWAVPPGVMLLCLSVVAPWLCLYWAMRERRASLAGAGLVQLGAGLAARRAVDDTFGVPVVYTLAQPLGQAAFLALLAGSFYKVLTGQGVTWKGRRYSR